MELLVPLLVLERGNTVQYDFNIVPLSAAAKVIEGERKFSA